MQNSEKHQAPVSFYNDAYLATCQVWQTQIVTCGSNLTSAMQNKASWVAFWDYRCPGCPQCQGWKGGKGGNSTATQSLEMGVRQQRRTLQNAVYKTMERFTRSQNFGGNKGGKSGGKYGGKFGGKGKDTRKPMYEKPKGDWGKGKGKGDWGKGDWGKGKGKDKKGDRQWY